MTGHTAEKCKYLSAIDTHILDLLCSGRTEHSFNCMAADIEHISCNSVKKIPKLLIKLFFLLRMLQLFFIVRQLNQSMSVVL